MGLTELEVKSRREESGSSMIMMVIFDESHSIVDDMELRDPLLNRRSTIMSSSSVAFLSERCNSKAT